MSKIAILCIRIADHSLTKYIIKLYTMKTGDFCTESNLIQKGFYFSCFFASFKVFKRFNQADEDYTYLFYDFFKKTIDTILKSKE